MIEKATVIYHGNCMDGMAAAWAFDVLASGRYGEVDYIPCTYGVIPNFKNSFTNEVFVLDFSFSREIIANMARNNKFITVLDHHKTAAEILQDWKDQPENSHIVFDMKRSGAGITWDELNRRSEPRPELIEYIEDRDLWKFELAQSKEINAFIAAQELSIDSFHALHDNWDSISYAFTGDYLSKQHQKYCEEIVLNAESIEIVDKQGEMYAGLVCNCTHQFASEVGNLLSKKSGTFGATYYVNEKGSTKWSLRSQGNFDVAELAKSYGGGGHTSAAGFTIDYDSQERPGMKLFPEGYFDQEVMLLP